MKSTRKKLIRKGLYGAALFLLLFIVCNDLFLPWYVDHGSTVEVPDVVGMQFDDAVLRLDTLGLEGRKGDTRMDREHPAGYVIVQNPLGGHAVKRGRRVYLTISGGEELVSMPSVRGRTLRDATFLLERTGLRIGDISYQPSDEYPPNTVMEQGQPAGVRVRREIRVDVTVSLGPLSQSVIVPSLVGRSLSDAKSVLDSAGIVIGNITYMASADLLPNTVLEQYPRAGDLVQHGQAIDLVVVQGAAIDSKPSEY